MLQLRVWEEITAGVYIAAGAPRSWVTQVMAAVLGVPDSIASHRTGGRLHGFGYLSGGPIELTVVRHTNHEERLASIHEMRDVIDEDVIMHGPIPVTHPARTVVDLAAVLRAGRLERVLDDALVRKLVTLGEVHERLERVARRGKPGVRVLRGLLLQRSEGLIVPTSELERALYRLIDDSALPAPVRQFHPDWWDSPAGTVDVAWPAHGLIVEADGRRWHSRDADFERDRVRDGLALQHGYSVARFSFTQVTERGPWVLDVIDSTLRHRARWTA